MTEIRWCYVCNSTVCGRCYRSGVGRDGEAHQFCKHLKQPAPKQDGQRIEEALWLIQIRDHIGNLSDDMGDHWIEGRGEAKQALLALFSEMMDEVIGEDYPTPNDGRVDSVAEPHYRHLRWQQRQRKELLLKQLEAK